MNLGGRDLDRKALDRRHNCVSYKTILDSPIANSHHKARYVVYYVFFLNSMGLSPLHFQALINDA